MPGSTFRKAEDIPDIDNCRIQIVASGVVKDWGLFITKSGTDSGSVARVLPVIGYDRDMIRLMQEYLPLASTSLDGIKSVLTIMEQKFVAVSSLLKPPIVLQFEESEILNA